MCPVDVPAVIEEHERLAKAGDPLHTAVAKQLDGVAERGKRDAAVARGRGSVSALFRGGRLRVGALVGAAWTLLYNYNTVEAVLLFSAVQVRAF
jgi:hypothetical protein